MAGDMKWVRYGLREIASKGRQECMDKCRIDVSEELATERNGRSVTTQRPSLARARSLRSDRAEWHSVGRYVATKRNGSSVATKRPSLARARSLRSDRAEYTFDRCVATFFELLSDV
ncbi:hypothetical protein DY000_02052771 [Brassica cretica]|uniref:Uncharacterized protein n=1 Tax=Brassica cretica TaxID=69181 RepID=A0ABQ7AGY8_BRACR|nr:hypothetical protein DY000_02052771 [Brassica cretica]